MMESDTKKTYEQYIAHTYTRYPLKIVSGKGSAFQDASGRELIDFTSGIGVNSLGFTNPTWVAAVKAQIDKLNHTSNLYYTLPQVELAKKLCEKTGMKKVFFANSGAEANEGMIKAARKYSSSKYSRSRCEIITLINSFHGRTIATLAATGQDSFHQNFGPFPAGFSYAEANNIQSLESKLTGNTCAIMVECIQGEGGVNPLDQDFATAVAMICKERDILLLVDEVQTGAGRTGTFLACEHYGLQPDIVTMAKGLGSGLPIGAVLFGEKTEFTLGAGDHGSTFGGNPIVCAGALAVVDSLDGAFLAGVAEKGELLSRLASGLPGVTKVSGKGLMLGVSLVDGLKAGDIVSKCNSKGVALLTAKEKIRFLPPLTISEQEIIDGIEILRGVLSDCLEEAMA